MTSCLMSRMSFIRTRVPPPDEHVPPSFPHQKQRLPARSLFPPPGAPAPSFPFFFISHLPTPREMSIPQDTTPVGSCQYPFDLLLGSMGSASNNPPAYGFPRIPCQEDYGSSVVVTIKFFLRHTSCSTHLILILTTHPASPVSSIPPADPTHWQMRYSLLNIFQRKKGGSPWKMTHPCFAARHSPHEVTASGSVRW